MPEKGGERGRSDCWKSTTKIPQLTRTPSVPSKHVSDPIDIHEVQMVQFNNSTCIYQHC